MVEFPAGTLTFLFSDVVASSQRWEADTAQMAHDLEGHDQTLRTVVESNGGRVFKHTGDGVCAVFSTATAAVRASVAAQLALGLPVRIGVHSGEAQQRDDDYFGPTLNRCARVMDTAHAGQIVVSAATAALLGDAPSTEVGLLDLGEHRLRDLSSAEHIFQVVAPGLREGFPALRSVDVVRNNLPVQRSSFVGRGSQIVSVGELLASCRLVTLTGVGGCGKTRLALEVAARDAGRFPQGVFFVDLAPLADPDLLTSTVASALGLFLARTEVADLATYLVGRKTLVVLDNCEHLVEACAELVDAMLSAGTDVKVLATSREALGVEGEHAFSVPSLDIETDAVTLFVNRAFTARPGLEMTAELETTATEICRRLDGMPLAIELAAARTAHLAPAEILDRLSDRFRLLTGGRRRVQRQQTLQATIDWSHDLLDDDEQQLLRRLAVFPGSFSLDATEAICHPDALDLIGSLVAKSLVMLVDGPAGTRYRLLESIRLYAEAKLFDADEADLIRGAHRDWYLAWIESIPVDGIVWSDGSVQLVDDADNLQAALEWSRQEDRVDLVARMACRMIGYWFGFGRVGDLAAWSTYLLEVAEDQDEEVRALTLTAAAYHGMASGDFAAMEQHSGKAIAIASRDSWVAAIAWSLHSLYWTYAEPERGQRCVETGTRVAIDAATPRIGAMIMTFAAHAPILEGDLASALEVLEVAAAMIPGTRNDHVTVVLLALLGDVHEAAQLQSSFEHMNSPLLRHLDEFAAAIVAIAPDRRQDAVHHLLTDYMIVRDHALPLGDIDCLLGFVALAAADSDYERASRLLATAQAATPFPFRTGASVAVYRHYIRIVRDRLDRTTLQRCLTEGAAQSLTTALDAEHARVMVTD